MRDQVCCYLRLLLLLQRTCVCGATQGDKAAQVLNNIVLSCLRASCTFGQFLRDNFNFARDFVSCFFSGCLTTRVGGKTLKWSLLTKFVLLVKAGTIDLRVLGVRSPRQRSDPFCGKNFSKHSNRVGPMFSEVMLCVREGNEIYTPMLGQLLLSPFTQRGKKLCVETSLRHSNFQPSHLTGFSQWYKIHPFGFYFDRAFSSICLDAKSISAFLSNFASRVAQPNRILTLVGTDVLPCGCGQEIRLAKLKKQHTTNSIVSLFVARHFCNGYVLFVWNLQRR